MCRYSRIPWSWSYRHASHLMWALGTELGSSGGAGNALNSPVPFGQCFITVAGNRTIQQNTTPEVLQPIPHTKAYTHSHTHKHAWIQNNLLRDWREGLVVKGINCSCGEAVWFPAPTWWLSTVCNSSSAQGDDLFSPPWTLHACGAQANMQVNTHTHKININKSLKISK